MKKILFVINTLGCGGAENALISLLNVLDDREYEISLYVLMNQGELIDRIPENVKILNTSYSNISVQSKAGVKVLKKYILRTMFGHGSLIKNLGYLLKNIIAMKKKGAIQPDKLLWRIMSDGGVRYTEQYDLAVAYLEGGSTYYVADQVKAAKKVAFIHTDYRQAGYTRELDKGCYECYASAKALLTSIKRNTGEDLNGFQIFEKKNFEKPEIRSEIDKWIDEIISGLINILETIFFPFKSLR